MFPKIKLIFCCLALFVFVKANAFSNSHYSKTDSLPYFLQNSQLPEIKGKILSLTDGKTLLFNQNQLTGFRSYVIIYFNPECGHCQIEAENISKNAAAFDNTLFLWLTYRGKKDDLMVFGEKYGIAKMPNSWVIQLSDYSVPAFYKIEFTPYIAVYNNQKQWLQDFRKGATPAEIIDLISAKP